MAAELIRYQIYCQTEGKMKFWYLPRNVPTPSTCPDGTDHEVQLSSVLATDTDDAGPTSIDHVPFVQIDLRTGRPQSQSYTIVSHDFTDRTSWYQNSIQDQNLQLVTSDNLTYQAPVDHRHWVDINSKKLTLDYKGVLERDGSSTISTIREVTVTVDDNPVDPADYTINFPAGSVTFNSPQSGTVRATFWHNDGVLNPSDFILNPPPGWCFRIEHVEIQFSKTMSFTNSVGFEIWAGGALSDYMDFNVMLFDAGYGQSRTLYRGMRDLINWCNNQYPLIPACGDLTDDILVFPFKFLIAPTIKSSQGTLIRLYSSNHQELVGEIATATFYMEMVSEAEI